MHKIQRVAGKGLGLFATQCIPRGQRILTDKALLSIRFPDGDILQNASRLSQTAHKTLLGLSVNAGKHSSLLRWLESIWSSRWSPRSVRTNHSIINIFRNNNFDIGYGIRAVFPTAARINHTCVPNAQGNFNTFLDAFTVHAVHDVPPGEEITVSYLEDQLGLREWRQQVLLERYGFVCNCATCDETSYDADARESRRASLRRNLSLLAETAAANSDEFGPHAELGLMIAMLDVYENEGIRGREVATL